MTTNREIVEAIKQLYLLQMQTAVLLVQSIKSMTGNAETTELLDQAVEGFTAISAETKVIIERLAAQAEADNGGQ